MTQAAASVSPSIRPTSGGTVASQLRTSPAVLAAIDTIVKEAQAKSALVTDVRAADPALKVSYDALMARAADVRGRGLLYPYIGSGIGNGALVELADGSVKWDMICGIGVHYFGHSDSELIREALVGSMDDTLKHGNLQSNMEAYEFAEVICAEARKSSRLKYAYVSTAGAMANENAIKVCYQKAAPAGVRVLAFKDCFMGRTVTMAQIGDTADYRQGIPLSTLVDYMPFWDAVAAERMGKKRFIDMCVDHLVQYIHRYPGQHACFIFELCQGEGGFNVGDRDYFKALMDVCKAHKIAIWDDEVQTFGRTNQMFAYQHFNLGEYVDVFCAGKLTQACVTMFTEEFNPKPGLLSGTFTGEGVSFRVGKKIVERLRDGNYYGDNGMIAQHQAAFRAEMSKLIAKFPAHFPAVDSLGGGGDRLVGGVGGMMRFTPFGGKKDKVASFCKTAFEHGVVLFYCGHGPYHLRMLPPMGVMKLSDWPRVFACLEKAFAAVPA